jgi:hypothetical protein
LRQTPRHRQQLRNLIIIQDDRHFYASVPFLAQFKRHPLGEGERFSHNPKKTTSYGRRPKSAAGGFMVVFFDIVDRAAQETSLSTAMAHLVSKKLHAIDCDRLKLSVSVSIPDSGD